MTAADLRRACSATPETHPGLLAEVLAWAYHPKGMNRPDIAQISRLDWHGSEFSEMYNPDGPSFTVDIHWVTVDGKNGYETLEGAGVDSLWSWIVAALPVAEGSEGTGRSACSWTGSEGR